MVTLCIFREEAKSTMMTRTQSLTNKEEASSTMVTRRLSRTARERTGPGAATYSNTLTKEYCSLS